MPFLPRPFSLPFVKREKVAKNSYSLYFDRRGSDVDFLPGQHVRMILDLSEKDPRSNRRFFSIASSPFEKEYLMLTMKIENAPSIFKQHLLSLKPRDEVRFWGPAGVFVLPEEKTTPVVFLAGGIGVTPFRSMILSLKKEKLSVPVTLLASFKSEEEKVFYKELKACEKEHNNLQIVYTLSNEKMGEGESGRISEPLIRKYVTDTTESLYFVCGSIAFVNGMFELLERMGVAREQIKRENFTGY